jgi:predicted cupin superfamily sugar epimerase
MQAAVRLLVEQYALLPHPEGGYYRETYRAAARVRPLERDEDAGRAASTAILYLLEGDDFSALHRIQSDEVWHFYAGEPLRVSSLGPSGERADLLLGSRPERGEVFQAVVPAGHWFGARLDAPGGYCIVGCTVAPGFEFADFELAERGPMLARYPEHRDLVLALTREDK